MTRTFGSKWAQFPIWDKDHPLLASQSGDPSLRESRVGPASPWVVGIANTMHPTSGVALRRLPSFLCLAAIVAVTAACGSDGGTAPTSEATTQAAVSKSAPA